MKHGLLLLFAALVPVVLCPASAPSQGLSAGTLAAVPAGTPGILGGHEFVPSTYIRDPFVRTFLRTGLGFGMTPELAIPLFTIDDKPVLGLKGSLLFSVLDVEYQQKIRDWVAVRGRFQVIGRIANATPALISQGVTLVSGFELGWLFGIERSDRFLLSVSVGVANSAMTDVYLQRFIDGIIANGGITPGARLVQTTPTMRGGAGIHGAYAISDLVGVTFSGNLDYGESVDRYSSDRWFHALVASVDFNLHRQNGPPLGFVVGVRTRSASVDQSGVQGTAQTFFGRIGYTGSQEFSFGIDLGYELTPVRGLEDKQGFLSALVDIRLYF